MSTSAQSPDPKKKRRFGQYLQNIKDSFTISRRTYPSIGWALAGISVNARQPLPWLLAAAVAAAGGAAIAVMRRGK